MRSLDLVGSASSREPDAKACTKCGQVKPLSEFYRRAASRAGWRSSCKACDAAASAARYQRDPEHYRAANRIPYARNREKTIARQIEYHRTPRGRAVNRTPVKRWQADNPHAVAARITVNSVRGAGVLVRAETGQAAGCECRSRLHAHHRCYGKKLEVAWLCQGHHKLVHSKGQIELKPGNPPASREGDDFARVREDS